ncbi:TetR/AcrR family transcriptional regulator, partial [Xanthomonas vasicola]|uniref:TetR/AcrR family transcriptional regulator n=1 Tax=Xanthomonas vasicola TaxID=56459 RepID=UPI000FF4AF9F
MAWDVEGTKRRLREAALVEFAAHGYEGTTVAGIAARSGVNKERLYSYFGDKRALWDVVL